METKFNSQICTTREQSERLIALGLKKETADMLHYKSASMKEWGILATPWRDDCEGCKCYYPAWSLHRLIKIAALCPCEIYPRDNIYDIIIDKIEELIKEGYFNKNYLEE